MYVQTRGRRGVYRLELWFRGGADTSNSGAQDEVRRRLRAALLASVTGGQAADSEGSSTPQARTESQRANDDVPMPAASGDATVTPATPERPREVNVGRRFTLPEFTLRSHVSPAHW